MDIDIKNTINRIFEAFSNKEKEIQSKIETDIKKKVSAGQEIKPYSSTHTALAASLQAVQEMQNEVRRVLSDEHHTTYRDHQARMKTLKKNLDTLISVKKHLPIDDKLNGTVGNLIGMAEFMIREANNTPTANKVEKIIEEYENDPVINAYIKTKAGFEDRLLNLKTLVLNAIDCEFADED